MSDTIELVAEAEPIARTTPLPPVHRAGLADINDKGVWLIPRMVENWTTTPQRAIAFLRGTLPANDQARVVCGDAIGMCHLEPSIMGAPARMRVDFVLYERDAAARAGEEGVDECCEIFAWMANYARQHGSSGLYRVSDFCDIDRSYIRSRIGRLTKLETLNLVF